MSDGRLTVKDARTYVFHFHLHYSLDILHTSFVSESFAVAALMQNLIVLCQYCFTWIEPHSEMCPECGAEVLLDRPDPDLNALADILGKPLSVLGPVRIERPDLPNYGHLIATTEGVLFLPRLHRRVNGAWEGVTSQRLPGWWPFRGDVSSPKFLGWLRLPFGASAANQNQRKNDSEQDLESLANRLMDSPGAFFIEHRMIRTVTAKRRTIKLDRSPLRSVSLIDETVEGSVCLSLNTLEDTRNAFRHACR